MEIHEIDTLDARYRALPGITRSDLSALHRGSTPAHLQYQKENPAPPTPALMFGIGFHAYVLDPDFGDHFAFKPDVKRNTKVGKLAYEAFVQENAGRMFLEAAWEEAYLGMTSTLVEHPVARHALLGGNAENEVVLQWRDDIFYHDKTLFPICKARLDAVIPGQAIYDLKTCINVGPEAFSAAILRHGYHHQAYWYQRGWEVLHEEMLPFVFVCVEKEPPYAVATYELDLPAIGIAERELTPYFETLAYCQAADEWPGHPQATLKISLPEWRLRSEPTEEVLEC